jgi:ribokinase
MTQVVVLGDVMVDVAARLAAPIAPGSDAPARIELRPGGSGANTAAWLAAAGAGTVFVGRVGDDERGQSAREALRAAGVDAWLAVDSERPTGTCIVLVAPDGERTMVPDAGANDALAPEDVPDALFAAGRHLHVSGYALLRSGSRPAARFAIDRARSHGMTVSVDPSSAALLSAQFLEVVAGADLLLPNADEAAALTGEADPERAAARLAEQVGEVALKLGAGGALWTDGRHVARMAALPVAEIVDSTGAGDAFAAGLIVARLEGAGPEAALAAGCRLAAEAVAGCAARPARGVGRASGRPP